MLLRGLLHHTANQAVEASVAPIVAGRPGWVTEIVQGWDGEAEESRVGADYVHVSSLLDFCSRRHLIAIRDDLRPITSPRSADKVLWAIGRGVEAHVRKALLRRTKNIGAVGKWACACRRVNYEGVFNPRAHCIRCDQVATNYDEFTLADHDLRIVGHPDFLVIAGAELHVLEIKSINKTEFDKLTRVKPDHAFQVSCYHKMLRERNTVPIAERATVLYVCKDYSFRGSPYLEFSINPQEGAIAQAVSLAWASVAEMREQEASGQLPPRLPVCSVPTAQKAKGCFACVNCFSR